MSDFTGHCKIRKNFKLKKIAGEKGNRGVLVTRGWPWFCSNRSSCGLSGAVHQFCLLDVLVTQSSIVSQPGASIFACDGYTSITKRGRVVMHHAVVIIRDSARVNGTCRHLRELGADSWRTKHTNQDKVIYTHLMVFIWYGITIQTIPIFWDISSRQSLFCIPVLLWFGRVSTRYWREWQLDFMS